MFIVTFFKKKKKKETDVDETDDIQYFQRIRDVLEYFQQNHDNIKIKLIPRRPRHSVFFKFIFYLK